MEPLMKDTQRKGAALVTGASRGIGKAIAAALVSDGWEVTGTCRNPRRLASEERVPGVRYLPLDLSRKASVEALLRKVQVVDLLVNNAGSGAIGPVEETPLEKVRYLFENNFFGAVRITQSVLPRMRARGEGTVIFIGSMGAEIPRPFTSFYGASKAALRAFSEALRMEVRGLGIRVALIAPLFIATTFPAENQARPRSVYAAAVGRVKKERDRMIMAGSEPGVVAEAVMDIISARRPRAFTCVGRHAGVLSFLARHLPRGAIEALSARRFKL
jgi:short-subunit dehydrogenase